ncbi:MAG TPA: hypothetical protein VGJ54_07520 [Streptosporangiaceae bacterium]
MGLREYPQAGLAEMPTEPGLGPPARESFPRRLLAALYGRPGELGELTRRWPNELGTYLQFGFGYLAGYPFGLKDTYDALWASLELAGATVAGFGVAVAPAPFQPGSGVADNPLVQYLDSTGQLDAFRDLRDTLLELEREGVVDALADGADLLAEAVGEAMIRWVASYGKALRDARTPFIFGWTVGRLAGRLLGEIVLAMLVNRALQAIAEGVGAATVRAAGAQVARLEAGVAEEAAKLRAVRRGFAKLDARMAAQRASVQRGLAVLDARRRAAAGQIVPAGQPAGKPAAPRGLLGAGGQPPPKALQVPAALPPSGALPALPGPQLLLGDLEPGGVGTAAPAAQASVFIVPATVSAAQRAQIAANLRNVPALPGWAYTLPDDVSSELVVRAVSRHPYTDPEVAGKVDRNGKPISIAQQREAKVSVLSGYAQETLFTIDPAFKAIDGGIVEAVRQDGRWELATLRFTNRVYYLDPGEGLKAVPRPAGLTDGLWIVRSKDPDAAARFVMPALVESKSKGNVTDLFYETLRGERLPTRGQVYRDVERVPNVTLILEFPLAGDRVERWVIPPDQVGISRRTTKFVLVWPPGPDRADAIEVLVNEGFRRSNVITLPPAFPRPQIEELCRRLLDTPLERLLPKELLPKKAKP